MGKDFAARKADHNFFPTHYSLTNQLFEVEKFNFKKTVLEPGAGAGHMVDILEDYFHYFKITSYDNEPQNDSVKYGDFLEEDRKFDYIITNPPYGKETDKFVLKAQKVCKKKFAFLLRTNYLSGQARYKAGVYNGLKNVHVFTRMPDFTSPIRDDGKYPTAAIVYAWMVWEIGYKGPIRMGHIDNQKFVLKAAEK